MVCLCGLLLLMGCVSRLPSHRPYDKTPIEYDIHKMSTVTAYGPWQDSTVQIQAGDKIFIDAKGTWSGGMLWESGPSGAVGPDSGRIYAAEPAATALIGRIGSGTPFTIGDQYLGEATQNGNLFMRMNDPTTGDNSGALTVDVYVRHAKAEKPTVLVEPSISRKATDIVIGSRYAVIIGISSYKDSRIPSLRYATKDARAFYDWIVAANGGMYAPSRVKLLLDQDATFRNIRDALFVWLKQAIEEDVITIYFAGHGSPESPDAPGNLFLLPYDAQYDSVATTGFPMWDIETALKRFIKAKKVVVIADACHSGGVGQTFDIARRASRGIEINPISSGLQNLSKIGDGVAVISASDEKQFSQESQSWGGGHGVFTFFLLKGLNGEADYNKDGRVTLGELIPYLSEQVRRETRNTQSPTVAGKFDPALSIGK